MSAMSSNGVDCLSMAPETLRRFAKLCDELKVKRDEKMIGQIPGIINQINALKYKMWARLGKEPNTIYMNIVDYRRLCEEAKDFLTVGADKSDGEMLARSYSTPRLTQIMLMRIVKRAGEIECAFVQLNDGGRLPAFVTAEPIFKKEFTELRPRLAEWLCNKATMEFDLRFKFEQRMPEVGESGIIITESQCCFVTRTSQNYLHSYGHPPPNSTQIPIECANYAVTMVKVKT